jgi:hypothetical protein
MFILATLMPNTRELSHFTTANWEKLPFTRTKQQQQQHNLLSQASWGRLEMKPKRDEKQGDT